MPTINRTECRVCAFSKCEASFVPHRPWQRFCSKKHAHAASLQRFKERHPDRFNEQRRRAVKRWRERNPEQDRSDRHRRTVEVRERLNKIKLESGCADCGYNAHPEALDFDHRPGETKLFQVGQTYTRSRRTSDLEIAKCDVVCANCHRIRTARRRQQACRS